MTQIATKARIVQALIKEKSELEDGWKLICEIASFKSQYPTILNRVPEADAARLKQGQVYNLLLERGNPKKGKDGSNRDWDYWWNYQGIAPDGAKAEKQEEAKGNAPTDYEAVKRLSIHRQVAVKLALEAGPETNWVQVFQRAVRIVHFLETGLDLAQKPATGSKAPVEAPRRAQTAPVAPVVASGPQPEETVKLGRSELLVAINGVRKELGFSQADLAVWITHRYPHLAGKSPVDLTQEQLKAVYDALYKEAQDKAAKKLATEEEPADA